MFTRFNYQLIWITSVQSCFEKFWSEEDLLPFFIEAEYIHPKQINLLQMNNDPDSQLEILPMMITRATTANRLIDHKID